MRRIIVGLLAAALLSFALVAPTPATAADSDDTPSVAARAGQHSSADRVRQFKAGKLGGRPPGTIWKIFKQPNLARQIITDRTETLLIRRSTREVPPGSAERASYRQQARRMVGRFFNDYNACTWATKSSGGDGKVHCDWAEIAAASKPGDQSISTEELKKSVSTALCGSTVVLSFAATIYAPPPSKAATASVGAGALSCFWDSIKDDID